jgi:lysophospholipase L1-like esterase
MKKFKPGLKTFLIFSAVLNIVLLCYALKKRNDFLIEYTNTAPRYLLGRNIYLARLPIDSTDIVFVGDSETQFFLLNEEFNNCHLKNRGIMGDTSDGLLFRLSSVTDGKPQKIFIQIGINDLLRGISPTTIAINLKKIIDRIKRDSPRTKIYVQSIFPSNAIVNSRSITPQIKQTNEVIYKTTQTSNVKYIDLFSVFSIDDQLNKKYDAGDGQHLSGEGYKEWVDIIKSDVL